MAWDINITDEAETWTQTLPPKDYDRVIAVIDQLADEGPALTRPLSDTLKGTTRHTLKELRTGTIRIIYAFDPDQTAIVLLGGDKRDRWSTWYQTAIPEAEALYDAYLDRTTHKKTN